MINTAFFGTSDKSLPILNELNKFSNLKLCVTKNDTIVGRKKEIRETLVKKWSKENNVKCIQISKFDEKNSQEIMGLLEELNIKIVIVADFSLMVPEVLINNSKYTMINIHFSLLPKYRGASPVQHAILNGDTQTGITYQLLSKKMDEGDILFQIIHKLNGDETTNTLYDELFKKAADKLEFVVKNYSEGKLSQIKQNRDDATYCYSKFKPKSTLIYKEDAKIDWQENPTQIERKIRAFNPWPIAWTTLGEIERSGMFKGIRLKNKVNPTLSVKIYQAQINIQNNEQNIEPIQLKVEGGNIVTTKEFINGYFEKN